MKAITLWEPWASLVMIGAKPFEFRPKHFTDYAGHPAVGVDVVMHAGKRPMRFREVHDLLQRLDAPDNPTGLVASIARPFLQRIADRLAIKQQSLHLGCGLGTVRFGEPQWANQVFPMLVEDSDRGQFNSAWPIVSWKVWNAPVPCRGLQGFWNWPFQVPA